MALSKYGNDGLRLYFGVGDFYGVGVTFGLAIVTPLVLLSYVAGGSILALVSRGGPEEVSQECRLFLILCALPS